MGNEYEAQAWRKLQESMDAEYDVLSTALGAATTESEIHAVGHRLSAAYRAAATQDEKYEWQGLLESAANKVAHTVARKKRP